MFSLVFFSQTAALVVVHLLALGVARAGVRAGVETRGAARSAAAALVVAGPLALALFDATGGTFLAAQLGLTLGYLGLVATEGRVAGRTLFGVHLISTGLLAYFLHWRGLVSDGQATPVLRYVLADYVHQLTFPTLGALVSDADGPFTENVRVLVVGATTGILRDPLLPLATLGYGVLTVLGAETVRGDVPAAARALARSPARAAALAIGFVAATPALDGWLPSGLGAVARAVLAPPLVLEGVRALRPLARFLVAPRVAAAVALGALVVLPELLLGAGLLGAFALFLPGPDDGTSPATPTPPRRLALAALGFLAPLGVVCAVGYARTVPALPADLGPTCTGLHVTRVGDAVWFTRDGAMALGVEVTERALEGSVADAEQDCQRRGRHLCTSAELFTACACDHGDDHSRTGLEAVPPASLVARATQTCGEDAASTTCRSDHGIEATLGGRSELCADGPFPGVHAVAGPNSVQRENWMTHCAYRSLASEDSLGASRPSFVGYRCCVREAVATP